jgi:protein ImuB
MSATLYACVHAVEFPAQALLRLRPDLAAKPVVVLEGEAPRETVCALNRHAYLRGVATGMTRLEVETLQTEALGAFTFLPRSAASEAAARAIFLECAAQFSPRLESPASQSEGSQFSNFAAAGHTANIGVTCAFILDIAGTERLFGPSEHLAARLRAVLAAAGFRVAVAVSANYHAARMKAAATRGIAVIPAGAEAAALEKLPISSLELDPDHEETFLLWGVRTLGELARMPESELVVRMGPAARTWRQLARGTAEHTLQPLEPALALEEFCEFENPVEQIDSLLFIGARMIDCLVERASARALSLAVLTVDLKLEDGRIHQRVLRPALPSTDRKFLLKLLQLEIGAHPPPAAVVAFTLAAQAGRSGKVQLGLFVPQMPEPSRLDVTLARLKAMVGEDRVGAPALEDTHRRGSFRMEPFVLAPEPNRVSPPGRNSKARKQNTQHTQSERGAGREAGPARMALRRMRPPTPIRVMQNAGSLAAFRDAENRFEVAAAYGPWRSSGCWWSGDNWDDEEWDVLATGKDGALIACLLVCDRTRNAWRLEAFYD